MPNRDGTGPLGEGSRTGRGAGNCTSRDGESGFRSSRRIGRRGAGRGYRFNADYPRSRRRSWLSDQFDALQSAIQNLTDRLDNLNKD
ncbi:MAG: DUF5320 domain-containing protein [Anaerolineales bacterium]|jgi:hypothetical protein